MRANLPESSPDLSRIKRLFLNVKEYQISDDGNHFVLGEDLLGNYSGLLKIRLTTIDERFQDKPKQKLSKIQQQYSNSTFGRDSLLDKAKSKANIIAFDELEPLNEPNTYRAHWLRTLSTVDKPSNLSFASVAHIELKQKTEFRRSRAFVEHILKNINLRGIKSRQELDRVFIQAFSPTNHQNNPQRPFAVMNLRYQNEPVFALLPRVYPSLVEKKILDSNTNQYKIVNVPASGQQTMQEILSGKRQGRNARELFALDIFRITYAALINKENCAVFSEGENKRLVEKVFNGIKNGKIEVNLALGLSTNFGPAAAQSYLDDSEKKYLSLYNLKREVGDNVSQNKYTRLVNGYGPTVLVSQKFEDGSDFLIHALSVDPYPKTLPLNEIKLLNEVEAKILEPKYTNPLIIDLNSNDKLKFIQNINNHQINAGYKNFDDDSQFFI